MSRADLLFWTRPRI